MPRDMIPCDIAADAIRPLIESVADEWGGFGSGVNQPGPVRLVAERCDPPVSASTIQKILLGKKPTADIYIIDRIFAAFGMTHLWRQDPLAHYYFREGEVEPVPGEGPQPAFGMIVGEAPGFDEAQQGRPFIGVSGRLLETALRAVGVAREEVYITNVVKLLPLDSEERIRRPYDEEIASWLPVLKEEIQNTAPAAILALGRTADATLEEEGIERYFAWHPAWIARQGGLTGRRAGEWLAQLGAWRDAVREAEARA